MSVGGEAAGGDADFQVAQRPGGEAAVGVEMAESAVAEHLHEFRVGVGHPGAEPEARRHEFRGVVDPAQPLVEGLAELLQRVHHRRVEQVRLRLEVVVEGAETHVRALGDRLDARAGVPGLGEDLPGGADERLAGLGAAALESVRGRG